MAIKSLAQSTVRQAPVTNSALAGYTPGSFHHLETVRLSATTASLQFTNLARYSDYQHFQIRLVARTARNDVGDVVLVQFNGDASTNYAGHVLRGFGSGVDGFAQLGQTAIGLFRTAGGTDTASAFGAVIVDILDPFDTTKNTTLRALGGSAAGTYNEVVFNSGVWLNTAAITSITLTGGNGSWVSGSRFSLYGLKARA